MLYIKKKKFNALIIISELFFFSNKDVKFVSMNTFVNIYSSTSVSGLEGGN